MKRIIIIFAAVAALTVSCKKDETQNVDNTAQAARFNAWIRVNHPNAPRTTLGSYVISEKKGNGGRVGDATENLFVQLEYTRAQLSGQITGYTSSDIAKQLNAYDSTHFYGPRIINRASSQNITGLEESLCEMNIGGSRKLAIPGWLTSYPSYATEEEYFKKVSGTDVIFEFTVRDAFNDVNEWECSQIEKYILEQGLPLEKFTRDTTGFYYLTTSSPEIGKEFNDDDTFTIHYTGARLDGQVFDSSVRKTYVDAGLNPAGKEFKPVTITYNKESDKVKFGSGSAIKGFSMALSKMRPGENVTVIFMSALGYSSQGGSDSGLIPAYCPLRFDIRMTDYTLKSETTE